MRTRPVLAVTLATLLSGACGGSGGSGVDKNDPSYVDGYSVGVRLQQNAPANPAEQACADTTSLAGLNPAPGQNLKLAQAGCVDGFKHAAKYGS